MTVSHGLRTNLMIKPHSSKGDVVFVYTDGVPEAKNPDGEFYKMDRLVEALNRVKDEKSEDIVRNVKLDIEKFEEGAEQYDDITMMCLEYFGK